MKKNQIKPNNPAAVQNIPEWITAGYLAAMLTVFLLFAGPGGYTKIAGNKFFLFVLLTVVYFALLAGSLLLRHRVSPHLRLDKQTIANPELVFLGLYVVFSAISAALSPFGGKALLGAARDEGLVTILLYCGIFLLARQFGQPQRWTIYLFGGSMTAFSMLSIAQLRGQNPFGLYPGELNYFDSGLSYQGEYLGTIGNVDLVAALLSMAIPLFLCYIVRKREDFWRFTLLIPLALSLYVCLRMQVLAAYLGVLAACVFAVPVLAKPGSRLRKISFAIICASALLALLGLYCWDIGGGFLHELHEILHGNLQGSFGSGRLSIWKETWDLIREHPWFGSGPDTLILWDRGFTDYDAFHRQTIHTVIDAAHSEYLNIFVNQGVFALFSYLGLLACILRKWVRCGWKNHTIGILGAAVVGYLVQAMFGMSMCMTAPYFWLASGLLAGQCKQPCTSGSRAGTSP